ncbi:universal stress protein [Pseudonocardia ailaonensis]|uniref:Universal stress protein n=1 Tax=Pseudonocardia ailaonensis TaxID=367279 RepID=A0ABN2NTM0_9PSEU
MTGPAAVVVGVDGSDPAADAARWAAAHAARHHLAVRLVRAYRLPPSAAAGRDRLRELARRQLWAAARAAHAVHPGLVVEQLDEEGDPFDVLLAESGRAQTLAVGARGVGGVPALLAGSVGEALTREARCPVAVVRGHIGTDEELRGNGGTRPVVVGIDGSPASEAAVAFAFAEADACAAPLVAVHAWPDRAEESGIPFHYFTERAAEEREVLAERLAGWAEKYPGVRVSPELVRGGAARVLLDRSRAARSVVVGSLGRAAVARALLGSTGRTLMRHASCPVVVTRP